jgi:hypothetical protein
MILSLYSCGKKILPGQSALSTNFLGGVGDSDDGSFAGVPITENPVDEADPIVTPPERSPSSPGGGYAEGAGCTGAPGDLCLGAFDNDAQPENLPVKVVLANPAGTRLTTDPVGFSRSFVSRLNQNYIYEGHRYLSIVLDESKVIEVAQESDSILVQRYKEPGYLTMILVGEIPGSTAGYVQNSCARIENGEAWTIFEFDLVNVGVVEHEMNHIFCFPHTSSQNGGTRNFYLAGYNQMEAVLRDKLAYKEIIDPQFKIFIDPDNNPNKRITFEDMVYDTHNLMFYSILSDRPSLFRNTGEGFPHSYSHLLDYYYWNFIKGNVHK